MSTSILVFLDTSALFWIKVDSLDFAIGTVLSQEFKKDSKQHLVAFFSKLLFLVEQNYEIYDKEMLAIIQALEEQEYSLEDAPNSIEIWTDHQNLKYFIIAKKLNHRQAYQSLYLARFNFILYYYLDKLMGKHDMFS